MMANEMEVNSSEENHRDEEVDDNEDGGMHATLHAEGPQESAGSGGHPDTCMPCTFYCFTRRGCNRGQDCKFCHLSHQSKLQQRREAWKKQQREKRKTLRERVAVESMARRVGDGDMQDKVPMMPAKNTTSPAHGVQAQAPAIPLQLGRKAAPDPTTGINSVVFTYTPSRTSLTMGQQTDIRPALIGAVAVRQFVLLAPLPKGLTLDPVSGIISGAPSSPCQLTTTFVEVQMLDGRTAQTGLDIEGVDFSRGGFVIGHISEFEPGRFMLVLYVPEEAEEQQPMKPVRPALDAPVFPSPSDGLFADLVTKWSR